MWCLKNVESVHGLHAGVPFFYYLFHYGFSTISSGSQSYWKRIKGDDKKTSVHIKESRRAISGLWVRKTNRCRKQMLFQSIYSDCFQFDMIGTLNLLMHVRLQFWLSRDHCWPYLVNWIYPFHQLTRSDRKDMIVGLTLVKKTSVDKLLKEEFHVAKLWILSMKEF